MCSMNSVPCTTVVSDFETCEFLFWLREEITNVISPIRSGPVRKILLDSNLNLDGYC